MKKLSLLLLTAITIVFLFNTCKSSDDEGVVIKGKILEQSTGQPIVNALVQISSPAEFSNVFSRSDTLGNYSLGTIEIEEITDLEITVSVPNFDEQTKTLKVTPDDRITGFDFELVVGDGDGDEGTGEPSGPSGGAASIELVSISNETINIAATGGITSSKFTFEVQDSSGNSLDLNNAVEVEFSILSGPGGTESIFPTKVNTNAQGLATATLKSGNIAGVVKVEARIERTTQKQNEILAKTSESDKVHVSFNQNNQTQLGSNSNFDTKLSLNNKTPQTDNHSRQNNFKAQKAADIIITSEPVAVTIHGGFPYIDRFSILSEYSNYEFIQNLEIPVSVLIGDEYTNPVKPGTAVYFEVTIPDSGIIDGSAEGHTNEEGMATVNFKPGGTGSAAITATTVDKNNNEIQKTLPLLLTSSGATISAPEEITIDAGDNEDIQFTVTDKHGNPMAPGTTIEVEIDTALILSGTTSATIDDEVTGGNNITDFKFNVRATNDFLGSANIIITVTSPSGVTTTNFIALLSSGSGVPGDPEEPASIELLTLSNETINIAESGGITNADFTFQVKDAAGRNLDANSTADIEFSILSNPGGATITPATVTTDAQGRITSNLKAGNTAGVVQIQAEVSGTDIRSKPVAVTIHGGFPDQDHFTLEPITDTNIEGFNRNGVEITYKVRAGDEFSNPVKPGTAIYFETTGGIIDGSAEQHTDETGYAEVTLYAGNPRPSDGNGIVTAKTTDGNGNEISESSPFIFSTSKADISTDITELELSPGESQSVDYFVYDLNGNPMAAGTNIEVNVGGDVELSGTTSHTMSNELNPGNMITDFNFTVNASDEFSGSETVSIVVTSPSGTVTANQDLVITSTGGGVSGAPAGAAALILENVEHETINIKETGGIVNTAFTFQVQDSSGRPLNEDNPVNVDFQIINGPGGDEGILPTTATTNSSGRVTSNLFSGNTAGVVMLEATVTRDDIGLTLRSKPVAITIHGGFPDLDHFSIRPQFDNFGGYDRNGVENTIEVIVGDKFSNPVKPGTAVYFETSGGIIEGSGIGHTNEQGRVSVQLISADPRPNDTETVNGVNFGGRDGLSTITAKTVNEDNVLIEKSTNVVFSTNSAIISANPTTFDLDPNGGASFDYTVTDLNGNPMPAGSVFEIETGEGIEVTGSGSFTLGDHLLPGSGATEFSFSIRDTDDENNDPADMTILIKVTAPNGNVTTYDEIQGIRRKTAN